MAKSANRPPPANLLLAALPPRDYARLAPTLHVIRLELRQLLHRPGHPIEDVYFPGGGFCSIVTVLDDDSMVEVATVGREGMIGMAALSKGDASMSATFVQAETDICYRMSAGAFRKEMDRRETFYVLLTRYGHVLGSTIMQTAACNAVHSIEQRLARWLLMAQDRIGGDEFPLTQEFVAMMLGTSRPTVTVVAGTLQRAGMITYHRGQLTIRDRETLESASCECYRRTTELIRKSTRARSRSKAVR